MERGELWGWVVMRATAAFLAFAVLIHLATVIYAVRQGLSAEAILARTGGNLPWLVFYILFAVTAAVHGALGLRTVVLEHTQWQGRGLDLATGTFAVVVALLGVIASKGLY